MTTIAPRAVPVSQVISPAPRSQWEALVAADPTSLTDQSPAWMDVLVESGGHVDASRLYVLEDGRRFVLPLARRTGPAGAGGVELSFPDGWGIGGLVGPGRDVDAIRAVLAELTFRGRLLTRIRPDPLDGALWEEAAGPDVVRRAKRAHVIDLTVGTDALRAGLHKSTRRNLVKGERAGLRVTDTATEAHLAAYYRLYLLSLERWAERSREPQWLARWRGVRRDPLSKLATMADRLGDGFRLWLAWEEDTPIAGSIVLLGNTAHGTRGAIDRERAGPTRASFLLEWLAIEEAVAHGCRSYHLGETGTASSLATFKEGFGGRSVPYADFGIERLPVSRADRALRTGVKRVIGFRDGT